MRKKFSEVFGKSAEVIRQYPLVLVMAFLSAISLICMSESHLAKDREYLFGKLSLVFSLGISLTFALTILSQRIKKEVLLQLLGILVLILFYFLLPEKVIDFTEQYAFLIVPSFILSHLLVSFIAFFGNKKELNFWQFNKNLFIHIFLTAVFTGILTAGVQLAIVAVDQLFDLNFHDSFYRNPFIILSVFGSCFIFLLFNVNGLRDLERDSNYPQILKFFTQYILIPLLLIYAVILYLYAFKILINWELPRGWVSYLVLAYSVVGIFALLLVHPLKDELSKSWVKVFSKIFYFTLLPLLVLLFTAIFTRILQYGYTEPRYFVLILAIWLCTVVIYFIIKKDATIKFVPVSLFIMGLFALACPYLNTFSVAKRSQKTELKNILVQNNLLVRGKIDFKRAVQDSISEEISNKFDFLKTRKELPYLKTFIKSDELKDIGFFHQKTINYSLQDEFKNVITAKKITAKNDFAQINLVAKDFQYNISDFEYLFKAYNYQNNIFRFEGNKLSFVFSSSNLISDFEINFNGEKIDLKSDLQKLVDQYRYRKNTVYVKDISVTRNLSGYEIKFIFDGINYSKNAGQNARLFINNESVLILIKKSQRISS